MSLLKELTDICHIIKAGFLYSEDKKERDEQCALIKKKVERFVLYYLKKSIACIF